MSEAITVADTPKKTRNYQTSKSIHKLGCHEIRQGDCLAAMKRIAPKSVDVVVTSPPYNINLGYNSYTDNKTEDEYLSWMEQVAVSIKRVLTDDGSFFLNISGSNRKPWLPFAIAMRLRSIFELQNHIVWVKSIAVDRTTSGHFKPVSGERFTHHNHEHIFHFTKTGNVKLDRLSIGVPFADKSNISRFGHRTDLRCRGNTWHIPYKTVNSRTLKFSHPGTFPVELPLWCIYLHGKKNMRVLDPFLGTGTTLIAAHSAGARGIGIELDGSYIETTLRRVTHSLRETSVMSLTEREMETLLTSDIKLETDDSLRRFIISLQERINKTTGKIAVTKEDLQKISRYIYCDRNSESQSFFNAVFLRNLE